MPFLPWKSKLLKIESCIRTVCFWCETNWSVAFLVSWSISFFFTISRHCRNHFWVRYKYRLQWDQTSTLLVLEIWVPSRQMEAVTVSGSQWFILAWDYQYIPRTLMSSTQVASSCRLLMYEGIIDDTERTWKDIIPQHLKFYEEGIMSRREENIPLREDLERVSI